MKLVNNELKYWEYIRALRNEKEVKNGFIDQRHIGRFEHFKFMFKYGHGYYICLENKSPIGFVGQIDGDIRIAVEPGHQGKGVGKFMINELMKRHPNAQAKVKIANAESYWMFKKCGFTEKYYILEKE